MTRLFCASAVFLSSAGAAHAHMGHVGELAGHAHWVGIAAALGAAALAALAAKAGKKKQPEEEQPDAEEANGEPESTQA